MDKVQEPSNSEFENLCLGELLYSLEHWYGNAIILKVCKRVHTPLTQYNILDYILYKELKYETELNSVPVVCKRTIPTEWPPLIGEVLVPTFVE
jgi:hypothetical protein